MFPSSRYVATFAAGMIVASAGILVERLWAAPAKSTGRQIVAFTSPQTATVVRQIARNMRANIVQISPSGAYVLVVPKPGQKIADPKDTRVSYVEPEIVMGVDPPAKELFLVVAIKQVPQAVLDGPKGRR